MRLIVKHVQQNDCYVKLPREFQKLIQREQSLGILCTPIQLTTMDGRQIYVGYNGSVSSSDTSIEINEIYAKLLNLSDEEPIQVIVQTLYKKASNLQFKVVNSADYEIVALRRYEIEGLVLNNIQVIGKNVSFPLFYQAQKYVILSVDGQEDDGVLMIYQNAEITIVCDQVERLEQPIAQQHLTVKIKILQMSDGLGTLVYIPLHLMTRYNLTENQTVKLNYKDSGFSKFYRKFSDFQKKYTQFKDPKKNQDKKQNRNRLFYAQVAPPSQLDSTSLHCNHAMQAKIQTKQEITILPKTKEDLVRTFDMNELNSSKVKFRIWSFQEGSSTLKKQITSFWSASMNCKKDVVINKGLIKVEGDYFYLTIDEEQLNLEITQLDVVVIACSENPNPQEIERRIVILPVEYLQLSEGKFRKLKKLISRDRNSNNQNIQQQINLFSNLNSNFVEKLGGILEEKSIKSTLLRDCRVLISGQKKFGCQFIPKYIKGKYKLNIIKINFGKMITDQQSSLEVVMKYLTYVMNYSTENLIILENIEFVMRNTDLIDFQQSYLILISEVLAKHLSKLLTNQPDVRVIFLVNGSKGLINKKLENIFTHELKLEKPNFEQRLKSFSNPLMADLADGLAFDDLSVFMERITNKSLHLDHDLEQELEALQGKSLKKTKKFPTFSVIGGSHQAKSQILEVFQLPMRYDFLFEGSGVKLPKGALIYGAPGCGKTYLAQAVVNELGVATIYVKGPELLDKYIGGSEQKVRELFERAASQTPCLIFFDEFDSIVPVRSSSNSGVTDRVVNQFLCYLDGVEENLSGVFILAATSRPDLIDPALLRPGRIERHIHLSTPSVEDIQEIIKIYKGPLQFHDVSIEEISQQLFDGGATQVDIVAFIKETRITLSSEYLKWDRKEPHATKIEMILGHEQYQKLIKNFKASLSSQQMKYYDDIYRRFSQGSGANIKKQKQALK